MPFDKYRNWPLPTREGNIFPVHHRQNLEEQVLKDLDATGDETEKLEILDSYAAYVQRAYRQEIAGALSIWSGRILEILIEPNILSRLPDVTLVHRGKPAAKEYV